MSIKHKKESILIILGDSRGRNQRGGESSYDCVGGFYGGFVGFGQSHHRGIPSAALEKETAVE